MFAAAILGAAAAVVAAEQVTVQRPRAEVLDAKGSAGVAVETVTRDAKLEVLGREGHWLHVRTAGGKVGYVPEAVLAKGGAAPQAAGLTGGSGVSATDAAAAGRGWDKEVEAYASGNGLDRAPLERMEALRAACRGQPLKDFEQQGGPGR